MSAIIANSLPILSFKNQKVGKPTKAASENPVSWRRVRLKATLVFTLLKSLGILT